MARYYVTVPSKGEHWGPYTRLLQAQDFARIGSQHGSPREVRRGKVAGKLVRKYADGERSWPAAKAQLQKLQPGEVPRGLRKNPMRKIDLKSYQYYVVLPRGIESGWEHKEDAKEQVSELSCPGAKVLTRKTLVSRGLDPKDNGSWVTGPVGNPKKKGVFKDKDGGRWRKFGNLGFYNVEEDDQAEYIEGREEESWMVFVKKTLKGKLVGSGTIEHTSLESSKYPRRPPRFELQYGYEASDDASRNREEFRSVSDATNFLVEGILKGWPEDGWENNPDAIELPSVLANQIYSDEFLSAYFDAALWSSTAYVGEPDTEDEGEPMDENYGLEDFDRETLKNMMAEARMWRSSVEPILEDLEGFEESQVGHDFWLTRNGHGVGFWDGDWPEPEATQLDEASKKAGEINLYVGDDGLIYSFQG